MDCNMHCNILYITGSKNSSAQVINQPARNIAVYSCQKKHRKWCAVEPDNQQAQLCQAKLKLSASFSRSLKGTFR